MARTKAFDQEVVIQKAVELFWRKGFYATSIQDLVAHLGINRASLYDTFGDKASLFKTAFQAYRQENQIRTQEFLNQYPSVKTGLKQLFDLSVKNMLSDADHKGCFAVNCTTELLPENNEMLKILSENKAAFVSLFEAQIIKGQEMGEIAVNKDSRAVAEMLFALYNGLQVISKVDPTPETLKQVVASGLSVLD